MYGILEISIVSARNVVLDGETGKHLFVRVEVGKEEKSIRKTSKVPPQQHPRWYQMFRIPMERVTPSTPLRIRMLETKQGQTNISVGKVSLTLEEYLAVKKQVTKWYPLEGTKKSEIKVRLNWLEDATLLLKRSKSGNSCDLDAKLPHPLKTSKSQRQLVKEDPKPDGDINRRKTKSVLLKSDNSIPISTELKPLSEEKFPEEKKSRGTRKNNREKDSAETSGEKDRVMCPEDFERNLRELMNAKNNSLLRANPKAWLDARQSLLKPPDTKPVLETDETPETLLPDLTVNEITKLLSQNSEVISDGIDLTETMQDLRKQIVRQLNHNRTLESDLDIIEKRISLLILNRTSVHEIYLQSKKKKKFQDEEEMRASEELVNDSRKIEKYGNLFHLLQTQPKYLAKLANFLPHRITSSGSSFIEMLIFTLYGDAFSPREEFLLLKLFKLAIKNEILRLRAPEDLMQLESVVPKMILTYNKRRQGKEYLVVTLSGPLTTLSEGNYDLTLETTDTTVLLDIFLETILSSINSLPYGLRLICSQIRQFLLEKFPNSSEEETARILSFFCYFKFMNPVIVNPNEYGLLPGEVDFATTKNLVRIASVLQYLFALRFFPKRNSLSLYNPWIGSKRPAVLRWFRDLVVVPGPKRYLKFDKYTELYSTTTPMIVVKLREIADMHFLVVEHLAKITAGNKDPLWMLVEELEDDIPEISAENQTAIQLVLKNKFSSQFEIRHQPNSQELLYQSTKELVIKVLKCLPPSDQLPKKLLPATLQMALEMGRKNSDKLLEHNALRAIENLSRLERIQAVSREDGYSGFLRSLSLEILNQSQRRERQQKEIVKLRDTLKKLRLHAKFMKKKLFDFENYLENCRENIAKKYKPNAKPLKFTYRELAKQGVIIDSDVPESSRPKMRFFISMPVIGQFFIEAKLSSVSVRKMQIDLEDLLEMKDHDEYELELDHVTLHVVRTLALVNQYFLK